MSPSRIPSRLAIATVLALAPAAVAEPPSYQRLEADQAPPRKLRDEPRILSRFPTTFQAALLESGHDLRAVDINGRVWQWSLQTGDQRSQIADTGSEPACADLSPQARKLAFADPDGRVACLDLEADQLLFQDATSAERTVTLRFSPDAGFLAGVTVGGQVRLWDVKQGKVVAEFTVERGPVQTVAFSADGRQLALSSFSPTVSVQRLPAPGESKAAEPPVRISLPGARVSALAFDPSGPKLVIAAADGTLRVHDLEEEQNSVELKTHPFAVWSIAFEPGGQRMATGSWDGTIHLWDTATWEWLQSVKTHEESVAAMVFDGAEGLISAGLDGRLLYWGPEVPTIHASGMIAGRGDSVWVAAYTPDGGKLFVGGRQGRFELWDAHHHELLVSRPGHPTTRCAAFSPDGQTLATGGDDGRIDLCDAGTGAKRLTLSRHRGAVSAVVFADEGRTLISACDGGFVKLWDTDTGREKASWREHRQQIYCAVVSPDGRWLVTGGGNWTTGDPGELIVWDLDSGAVRAQVAGHKLAVWTIVFTRDGQRFVSSDSSGAAKVWNLESLEEERTLQHSTWIRPLAMSPDGQTLAVGRGDGSVRLWDTSTWTEKAACDGHHSFTFWLQFAPHGQTLATCGEDGTVRFWPMDEL